MQERVKSDSVFLFIDMFSYTILLSGVLRSSVPVHLRCSFNPVKFGHFSSAGAKGNWCSEKWWLHKSEKHASLRRKCKGERQCAHVVLSYCASKNLIFQSCNPRYVLALPLLNERKFWMEISSANQWFVTPNRHQLENMWLQGRPLGLRPGI